MHHITTNKLVLGACQSCLIIPFKNYSPHFTPTKIIKMQNLSIVHVSNTFSTFQIPHRGMYYTAILATCLGNFSLTLSLVQIRECFYIQNRDDCICTPSHLITERWILAPQARCNMRPIYWGRGAKLEHAIRLPNI